MLPRGRRLPGVPACPPPGTVRRAPFAEGVGDPDDEPDPSALRIEELILGSERQYTPFQAARAAGVSMELASRFWRAMGFADVGQARALTEADVLALRRLSGLVEAGLLSETRRWRCRWPAPPGRPRRGSRTGRSTRF